MKNIYSLAMALLLGISLLLASCDFIVVEPPSLDLDDEPRDDLGSRPSDWGASDTYEQPIRRREPSGDSVAGPKRYSGRTELPQDTSVPAAGTS